MSMRGGSNILVIGGAGSLGSAFIRYALDSRGPVIFARAELRLFSIV